MKKEIHVWHLELTDPAKAKGADTERDYQLHHVAEPLPEFARYLYLSVGAPWIWYQRLVWPYRRWQSRFQTAGVELWIASKGGTPIGYFELERQPLGSAEICYFGLIPEFIGEGFGANLLEDAISCAWKLGGKRVWLHTCSMDHPSALQNYLSRGFAIFREENVIDEVPDQPIEPWWRAHKHC